YFAAQTKHIGLYALPEANIEFSNELKQYKTGKGSIQFLNKEDLPLDLIKQIIDFRIHLIDELGV
ncbi:MAG: iron chaperone, partial [Flavobacteriaceae bacterium]